MELAEVLELLRGWDGPKILSLLSNMAKVNLEAADKIASGRSTFQLIEIIRTLVNKSGLFIPETFKEISNIKGDFKMPDKKFSLERKDPAKVDYRKVIEDVDCAFEGKLLITISAQELLDRGMKVVERIKTEEKFASFKNLLNGPFFFSPIPRIKIGDGNHGKILQDLILPALKRAYLKVFPQRTFNNYLEENLEEKVSIVPGMHYEKVIAAMEQGGMFISFSGCFQGFSPIVEREVVLHLPEDFILSGIYDMPIEMMGHTEVFAKDFYTLGRNVSSAQWQSAEHSLGFKASDALLAFGDRLLGAGVCYSGGVLFLG
jgi:hypothetical protein